jgi:hypothetical protein
MTDANPTTPHSTHRPTSPAWRTALQRWWRAGQERSLVLRRRGVDHVRLPLNLVALFALVTLLWSWPLLLLAIAAALVAQVEFVVQRETIG